MKTIYLVRKMGRYSTAPTNIRAFETMLDAEDLINLFKRAGGEGIEIVTLELSVARVDPLPPPPPSLDVPDFLGRGLRFADGEGLDMPKAEDAA